MPKEIPAPTPQSPVDTYISLALGVAVVVLIGAVAYNMISKNNQEPGGADTSLDATQSGTATLMELPAKHTVKDGETLWSIAENYYNSGYNWVDIAEENKLGSGDSVAAGTALTIPDAEPIEVGSIGGAATSDVKPKNSTYTVQKGDSLWNIALAQYGTGYKWPDIAKANKIANPDLIFTGTVLTLP